jgi:hypothetical protein
MNSSVVWIKEEIKIRLNKNKIIPDETYNSVIKRALDKLES